ncbi:ABC-2 type transport system permease protein [Singulisphaera sp. GP187]|uniref:DUF3526 domain-containing protein n=1 Tax=Singulisphaera sp. GP187 TaxID=1882752 RepID=UPI000928D5D5|nr:DUF3526 domain-containing protein [Singulisphaera sp. GP187]SIO66584.1 ABC-2 type transport system permease protein [Singulisphaera sp. GP187]
MSTSVSRTPQQQAANPVRKDVSTSVLKTSMRCEWRLLRTDLGWWSAIALLLACLLFALHNGCVRLDERARSILAEQQDEAERLATLTRQLGQIERGEVKPPDAPYRDPGNAIYVGRRQAATVAYLPNAPLAVTAVGLADLYPHSFQVSAGSKDSFLFVDEIANPTHLLSGSFDVAFVIVYLYPLVLLALSYNVLSSEREQGTLALTVASSAPLMTVLAGKLAVRTGSVIAAAIVTLGCALLLVTGGAAGLASLALLTLTIGFYGLFWVALSLLVNSLGRDSSFNTVALVMAWVLLLLVAPAAMNATAQVFYPTPPRSEMVLAVRHAAIDAERDREATETKFREEHRSAGDRGDARSKQTLAVTLAADARADAMLANHEAQVRAQRRLSDRLAYLVPPVLINDAIVELAGNGPTRWDDYLERIGRFHTRWQSFFVDRASQGVALTSADYKAFPRFASSVAQTQGLATITWRVLTALTWVAAISTAIYLYAARRISHQA